MKRVAAGIASDPPELRAQCLLRPKRASFLIDRFAPFANPMPFFCQRSARHALRPRGQAVAWLSIALVVTLSIFSGSPQLHAWLHAHEPANGHESGAAGHHEVRAASDLRHEGASDSSEEPDDDAGCIVTIFAHGVSAVFHARVLAMVRSTVTTLITVVAAQEKISDRSYLRPPTQAPPSV